MVSTHVYVPSDLYDWLKDGAKRNRRSVNQQVLYLLERIHETEQPARRRAEDAPGYQP